MNKYKDEVFTTIHNGDLSQGGVSSLPENIRIYTSDDVYHTGSHWVQVELVISACIVDPTLPVDRVQVNFNYDGKYYTLDENLSNIAVYAKNLLTGSSAFELEIVKEVPEGMGNSQTFDVSDFFACVKFNL